MAGGRVSLLHLAARQIDALAPEKFAPEDERRGVPLPEVVETIRALCRPPR